MAQSCTICNHTKRLQIDRELATAKNVSEISRKYDVDYGALTNHRDNHLSRQLVNAMQKKEALEGMTILSDIEHLIGRTKNILDVAETKKQYGLALGAIREVRESYKLLSQIAFSLHAARQQELEMERLKQNDNEADQLQDLELRMQSLTDEELSQLAVISRKLNKYKFEPFLSDVNDVPFESNNISSWEDESQETTVKPMVRTSKPKAEQEPEDKYADYRVRPVNSAIDLTPPRRPPAAVRK